MALPQKRGYCDLCVSDKFDFTNLDRFEKLGYNTIAVNTYIEENNEPEKKRNKRKAREIKDFPPPIDINKMGTKLKILSRITIEFTDTEVVQKIAESQTIKQYDLLAIVPLTLKALEFALSNILDIDIISLQPEVRTPYRIYPKLYKEAVEKGICFELPYSPMIKDSMFRQNILAMGHLYYQVGKAKNVIMSSNADHIDYVRGIYDVRNLGFLFHLKEPERLAAVRDTPEKLITKAISRKKPIQTTVSMDTDENKT